MTWRAHEASLTFFFISAIIQRMKIAIDCRMIGSGGIGSYISSLLPFFIKEHECLLIGRAADISAYAGLKNVQTVQCSTGTFSLEELLFFPSDIAAKINSCDVYYSPYCNIPRGIKIPIYTTIHDVVFLDVPSLAGTFGTAVRRWFYRYASKKSRAVFTVSEFSRQRIIHHLNARDVVVTYSAVPEWLNSDEKIKKEDKILFVGNIKRHKGLHTLIPAFLDARKKGLDAKLVIVGNAENFRTGDRGVSKMIGEMPEGSVDFTGRIGDDDLRLLYKKSRVLVQPSLYEGFGLPPLEALQSGTNVVLSDIPVFREIYRDYPVSYFRTEDASDLSEKILSAFKMEMPENLPRIYSFERTYGIINNALKSTAN